jgi:hypothetical protein
LMPRRFVSGGTGSWLRGNRGFRIGRAASGDTLVRVTIPITQQCYNSTELSTTRVSASEACAHKSGWRSGEEAQR